MCTFCQNRQIWSASAFREQVTRQSHSATRRAHTYNSNRAGPHAHEANQMDTMFILDTWHFQNRQFQLINYYSCLVLLSIIVSKLQMREGLAVRGAVSLKIFIILNLVIITKSLQLLLHYQHTSYTYTTMSRKQKDNKSKTNNSKQQSIDNSLTMLSTAQLIQIQLPSHLNYPELDQNLLKHYIKAVILPKRKVSIKEPVNVTVFGRNVSLNIIKIKRMLNPNLKIEEGDSQYADADEVLVVNNKVELNLVFEKSKEQKKQDKLKDIPKFYGQNTQYQNFKKIVWENFKLRQKLFEVKLGTIRGIIVGGPTGTGKSTFIRRLQIESQHQFIERNEKIYFHTISATQLLSRVVGGAEEYVRKTFKTLATHKYSIFIIEDMHLLFGEKELQSHQTTLATLFSQMDKYENALIVIGTYNSERDLSSVVFQSGRFEKQITLNLPNHHQRLQILKSMFNDLHLSNKLQEDQIKQFNLRLNGFSIGQIKQILRDAFIMKGDQINRQILLDILKQYRPSQIKQLIVEVPEVYWSGIGGYESVKHEIRKVTEFPLKYPQKFQLLGIQPSKGVLLYGPPGCSKTMMAKAIATQSKLNFIGIKGPELFSKYVGQSQRAIRNVFRKARAFSPCIIFFDEIDALASQRNDHNDVTNRLLGQLLTQMDGVEGLKQVIIIAATNRPQILDEALTRPGRFDHLIYVGPPDVEARKQIFKICLQKTPLQCNLDQISTLMSIKSQNYTGAQITLVCRQAALAALQQNLQNPIVAESHLQFAISKVKNRLTQNSIARYEQFSAKFKGGPDTQLSGLISAFGGLGFNKKNNEGQK